MCVYNHHAWNCFDPVLTAFFFKKSLRRIVCLIFSVIHGVYSLLTFLFFLVHENVATVLAYVYHPVGGRKRHHQQNVSQLTVSCPANHQCAVKIGAGQALSLGNP